MDGMISNTVVEGSMNRAMFLDYLEFSVVHFSSFVYFTLKAYPYADATVQSLSGTT
jgi:hypothetical protein